MTKHLAREHFVYKMDQDNAPVLTVQSGDQVEVDTYDCFENQIKSEMTEFSAIDWDKVNPATGPIFVEGAQKGDILKVRIDDIELGDRGVMVTGPGLGVMGHRMEDFQVKIIPIQDGRAVFNDRLALPLNPMIGVIGVAPENEGISCGTPGAHGGNMDTKEVTTGATLYFPVFHEGALLSLGDLHAAMGDGEISVSGIEIQAKVKITVEVIKGYEISYPFLENGDGLSVLVSKETLDESADTAVELMIDYLQPQTDLTLSELTMLMSAVGQVQVSQIVDPLKTARFFVPRYVLEAYGIKAFR
ncbi:acetamidase/formamidase family protein [Jeotgalibacillus sp. R-1-5s-1]|uniref:acetamidase/formamidase family protein n=1 Tax=Jeotgalibacillus sp. R-1-5s-1 TaxID=2555897 RepID=UPI001069B90E|nr:acetamidase/formamidase family protein [Jeotgalibacillus sp. R-1-5s-1]TFD97060.1 acetamidase [Jeotgalibacillus sp. R-1-5s-1]